MPSFNLVNMQTETQEKNLCDLGSGKDVLDETQNE